MNILRLCAVGLIATLAAPVPAEPESAEAILAQAQTAARAVTAIQYEARTQIEGPLAPRVPKVTGTVLLAANPGGQAPRVRADVHVDRGPLGTANVQLVCDGKHVVLVDHGRRVYARRDLPEGGSLLSTTEPGLIVIHEFVLEEPFKYYAKSLKLTYVGEETVEGTPCQVVQVGRPEGGNPTQWFFAKSDHLPRRLRHTVNSPAGQTVLTITLKNLRVQPPLAANTFELDVPEGFEDVSTPKPRGGGRHFLEIGSEPPDWTLKDDQGREVSLKSLRGKIVVMDFWATWCAPCRLGMPSLQKLHERFKDQPVVVYGVNCWQHRERRKLDPIKFMRDAGFTYPLLLGGDRVASAYKVSGIPACYVIGPDGKILYAYGGWQPDEEKRVEQLIVATLREMAQGASVRDGPKAAGGNGPTSRETP